MRGTQLSQVIKSERGNDPHRRPPGTRGHHNSSDRKIKANSSQTGGDSNTNLTERATCPNLWLPPRTVPQRLGARPATPVGEPTLLRGRLPSTPPKTHVHRPAQLHCRWPDPAGRRVLRVLPPDPQDHRPPALGHAEHGLTPRATRSQPTGLPCFHSLKSFINGDKTDEGQASRATLITHRMLKKNHSFDSSAKKNLANLQQNCQVIKARQFTHELKLLIKIPSLN